MLKYDILVSSREEYNLGYNAIGASGTLVLKVTLDGCTARARGLASMYPWYYICTVDMSRQQV